MSNIKTTKIDESTTLVCGSIKTDDSDEAIDFLKEFIESMLSEMKHNREAKDGN